MPFYWIEGTDRAVGSIGAMEPFKVLIEAADSMEARAVVLRRNDYAKREHVLVKSVRRHPKRLYWSIGEYGCEIALALDDAQSGSHQGACDDDIEALRRVQYIADQLEALDDADVRRHLKEYGAWGDADLVDHDANLDRVLWLACGDIVEEYGG